MQRYFVAPEQFRGVIITITGEDAHHAARVMRMKPDDQIIVCDGVSRSVRAVVLEASPQEIRAEAEEELLQDSEPAWSITIAQGLPKADKMELVIQRAQKLALVPLYHLNQSE